MKTPQAIEHISDAALIDYARMRSAWGWSLNEIINSAETKALVRQLWLSTRRHEREQQKKAEVDYLAWVEKMRGPLDGPQFHHPISPEKAEKIAPWLSCLMTTLGAAW